MKCQEKFFAKLIPVIVTIIIIFSTIAWLGAVLLTLVVEVGIVVIAVVFAEFIAWMAKKFRIGKY